MRLAGVQADPVNKMKVLLTGATGFVGSHILDCLLRNNFQTVVLLRKTSNTNYINHQLARIEICYAQLSDVDSLIKALDGVSYVIHCAGLTKAVKNNDFFEVNHAGTRNLLRAINSRKNEIKRLVFLSSLAAAGPVKPGHKAKEDDPVSPVSLYGKSKLAAEKEIISSSEVEYVIVRPPAVYGPRDEAFFPMFKAIYRHIRPLIIGGTKELSLVFVEDLAQAVVQCMIHSDAKNRIYYIANPDIVTPSALALEIQRQLNGWAMPFAIPVQFLWFICAANEFLAKITKKPVILNRQKYRELKAHSWVCDPSRAQSELGINCKTNLDEGIRSTLAWYYEHGWLPKS